MSPMDASIAGLRAAPRGLRERLGPRTTIPFGYVVDGPHGHAHVFTLADVEICIAALCRDNGDDPEDYTATEVLARAAWSAECKLGAALHIERGKCLAMASCIECGCDDLHACAEGCSWLRVDRKTGLGLCSMCTSRLADWDAGNRTLAWNTSNSV